MPEHPTLGVLVGFVLAFVFAASIWTVAELRRRFIRRQLAGFLGVVAIGLAFYALTEADLEWMGLLGIVWVVMTSGLRLVNCFHVQIVNAKSADSDRSPGRSQISVLELFVFTTAVAFSAAFTQSFSHPEYMNFFMLFAVSVALTCLGMGVITVWASLSTRSYAIRYTLLVVATMLFAGFVHQAIESAMTKTRLSRPGVAGFVWVAALVTYVATTSILLWIARYRGYRIARLNERSEIHTQQMITM